MIRKNYLNSWKKKIAFAYAFVLMMFQCTIPAYALSSIPLVEGTKKLFADLTPILVGVGLAITLALVVYRAIKWNAADEQEKPRAKKQIIETIIGGILITTLVGTLSAILTYYGGSSL